MNRRNFLALLSTPVLVALLDACASAGDGGDEPDGEVALGEARSAATRRTSTVADVGGAAASINGFGLDLFRSLAAQTDGNLVVSPTSIATALTMVAAGAGGTTLAELVSTLRIADPTTVHHAMNALTAELDRRSAGDVTLSIANSLWAQQGLAFETPFLDVLAGEYGAGLHLVDYRNDPDDAVEQINGWVERETAGRIPELLAKGSVSADARLTVVNAVHLRAPWATQFDPAATEPGSFTTANDERLDVSMMFLAATLPYATGDGWQAVELAYAGGDLAMLLFLPETGFLSQFEQIFRPADATPYLEDTMVRLSMPRFEIETALALSDALRTLGIVTAFTPDADFGAITTEEALRVSQVVHQANITVDEGGTEAAAATAVIMDVTAAPSDEPEPAVMVLDRPFVFVLRDRPTDTVLFVGRVDRPTVS